MIRKLGFYWVLRDKDSDWNIADWNGRSWMLFMYSLPSPVIKVYKVGPYVRKPSYDQAI